MKPTMKHIQYARDDIQTLAKRLNLLYDRVQKLEASLSKSSKK
jgi:hypothetical protein